MSPKLAFYGITPEKWYSPNRRWADPSKWLRLGSGKAQLPTSSEVGHWKSRYRIKLGGVIGSWKKGTLYTVFMRSINTGMIINHPFMEDFDIIPSKKGFLFSRGHSVAGAMACLRLRPLRLGGHWPCQWKGRNLSRARTFGDSPGIDWSVPGIYKGQWAAAHRVREVPTLRHASRRRHRRLPGDSDHK